jgi:HSP20 family molecular chaperone IbpA
MNAPNLTHEENKNDKLEKLAVHQKYTTPAVDIYEQDGGLTLVADMPGVAVEKLKIDVDHELLTLEGETAIVAEGDQLFSEFAPAGYYRQFRLPEHLDLEKIDARLRDGVLTLKLPKASAAIPRRIEVKALH